MILFPYLFDEKCETKKEPNKQGIELLESRCALEQATGERASAKAVALTNKQRTSALARKPLR
jgi:hypothetical protein